LLEVAQAIPKGHLGHGFKCFLFSSPPKVDCPAIPPEIGEANSPFSPAPAAAPWAVNQNERRSKLRIFWGESLYQNAADCSLHRSGREDLPLKTTRPFGCGRPKGLVIWEARTATLSPEIKEGSLSHHHNTSTPQIRRYYFFFLAFFLGFAFAFFLAAIGTSF
jgi:hypothetical protein